MFFEERIGIIPARWGSSRFPGKPLVSILGKSLIQRTYERAIQSSLVQRVIVATDDDRIAKHIKSFQGDCVMTSSLCSNGTERVAEAVQNYCPHAQIVVNIQGDEPCLNHHTIDQLIAIIQQDPTCIATPVFSTPSLHEYQKPSNVKCVLDLEGNALYFSRAPIPYHQSSASTITSYIHVGMYAYSRLSLFEYITLPPTPLSQVEDLEQLRLLEHGKRIRTCITQYPAPSVDIPEDVQIVEEYLSCHSNAFL